MGEIGEQDELSLFLLEVMTIIVLSRVLSFFMKKYLKQPSVVAELISGIILGPTALGKIPNFSAWLFPLTEMPIINVIAQIGIIFFMFIIGIELDPKLMRNKLKSGAIISISSIATPFVLGILFSFVLHKDNHGENGSFAAFLLFFSVSVSITAFPVLARILTEEKLLTSRVGTLALSAAAINDVIGWLILAFAVSVGSGGTALSAVWTTLAAFGFLAFMAVVVRYALGVVQERFLPKYKFLRQNVVVFTFFILLASAYCTEIIGIHALFGAFTFGAVFPKKNPQLVESLVHKIEDVVVVFLLPVYFVFTGLRTDLTLLNDGQAWLMALIVLVVACAGKIGGAGIAAKFAGLTFREALTIGILMDTRGLVELIVLNIGLDLGIINKKMFAAEVVMALVTTFATSPLVHFLYTRPVIKQEIETRRMLTKSTKNLTMLLCVSDSYTGGLATIAKSLFDKAGARKEHVPGMTNTQEPKNKPQIVPDEVYALHLVDLSDRPSVYMKGMDSVANFTASMNIEPDAKKDGYFEQVKKKNAVTDSENFMLTPVLERARFLGLDVEMLSFISNDIPGDIVHMAETKIIDLVLMVSNSSYGGSVIKSVIQNVSSSVGILYDRDLPVELVKVLYVFTGPAAIERKTKSFHFAERMVRNNIQLTCLQILDPENTDYKTQFIDLEDDAQVTKKKKKYMKSEEALLKKRGAELIFLQQYQVDPVVTTLNESNRIKYDLIIVGTQLESASFPLENLINGLSTSLLLIHQQAPTPPSEVASPAIETTNTNNGTNGKAIELSDLEVGQV
eukprot:CAMPEP_0168560814 /NCGR_PEP_ID=MMETSP0413-20121227/11262_1 /TAXON_ID=136452 /ORGANISM="Filamoeba nolandi, Strain NC-AS-23-1" /LENGTH=792 /DNA_ID=CAMNT_0008592143 /DNA_START=9 /DNA_END=2387 /DNA_ORIENTATION=-